MISVETRRSFGHGTFQETASDVRLLWKNKAKVLQVDVCPTRQTLFFRESGCPGPPANPTALNGPVASLLDFSPFLLEETAFNKTPQKHPSVHHLVCSDLVGSDLCV